MPYLTEKRKLELKDMKKGFNRGDANFLITTGFIIPTWEANKSYDTIARLEELLYGQTVHDSVLDLIKEQLFRGGLPWPSISSACRLAYLEFYRRVGSVYEDTKIAANGDVYYQC